jgi:hypothetical protein
LQLTFFPLLKLVDSALYEHMVEKAGLTLPSLVASWISNWFATDIADIAAASRMVDVFLVSHATMPLYCAIAVLTHHREQILSCEPVMPTVYATVRSLPLFDTSDVGPANKSFGPSNFQSTSLTTVEHLVTMALKYM